MCSTSSIGVFLTLRWKGRSPSGRQIWRLGTCSKMGLYMQDGYSLSDVQRRHGVTQLFSTVMIPFHMVMHAVPYETDPRLSIIGSRSRQFHPRTRLMTPTSTSIYSTVRPCAHGRWFSGADEHVTSWIPVDDSLYPRGQSRYSDRCWHFHARMHRRAPTSTSHCCHPPGSCYSSVVRFHLLVELLARRCG